MNIYCSRKVGATIKGKFYPLPTVSAILERQIRFYTDKRELRRRRNDVEEARKQIRHSLMHAPLARKKGFFKRVVNLFHRPTSM